MSEITYSEMVELLAKPGEKIKEEMTLPNLSTIESAISGAINLGQYLDTLKKQVIYQKDKGIAIQDKDFLNQDILSNLTPQQCHMLHMAMGIFGEAAEILTIVHDHVFGGEPLNINEVREELGDQEFYLEGFRQSVDVNRDVVLEQNYNKLYGGASARYKNGYSDKAANDRADKA